tara:strand:- start:58500 stop:59864 length:1365 start_codon:yes stop_codon:yes gene_type:complete
MVLVVGLSVGLGGCTTPLPTTAQLMQMTESDMRTSLELDVADVGYHVIDADTGAVLASQNADAAFPPASTAKLATMIAALGILGPEHRFRTKLLARGTLKGSVLSGDIVLQGDGDPLFSANDLRALAVRLADIGIKRVDGRFLYHSTLPVFADIAPGQPVDAPYNQGVSGLNFEFNRVTWTKDSEGIYVTPDEAENLTPALTPGNDVAGELPVRAPNLLSARMLQRFAANEGVQLPSPAQDTPPDGAVVLAEVYSLPLLEIARAGLEYSNNMVAEAVGVAAARATGAPVDTLQQSAHVLGLWLEMHHPNLKHFAKGLVNHSGLSVRSRVTPVQMTALLQGALSHRLKGWRFDTLLTPGGGHTGFRGRFKQPDAAYRIWAKSGTMRYIKGLAGYIDAASGRRLIFALFVYDPNRRQKLEENQRRRSDAALARSDDWRTRSDLFETTLIRHWISSY